MDFAVRSFQEIYTTIQPAIESCVACIHWLVDLVRRIFEACSCCNDAPSLEGRVQNLGIPAPPPAAPEAPANCAVVVAPSIPAASGTSANRDVVVAPPIVTRPPQQNDGNFQERLRGIEQEIVRVREERINLERRLQIEGAVPPQQAQAPAPVQQQEVIVIRHEAQPPQQAQVPAAAPAADFQEMVADMQRIMGEIRQEVMGEIRQEVEENRRRVEQVEGRMRQEQEERDEEIRQREEAYERRQARIQDLMLDAPPAPNADDAAVVPAPAVRLAMFVLNEPAAAPSPPVEQPSEELLEKNLKIPFSYKDFEVEMVRNQSRVEPKTVLECIGKNVTTMEWSIYCHSEQLGNYTKKKTVKITNLKSHFAHCERICKQHKVSRIDLTFRNATNKMVNHYQWK